MKMGTIELILLSVGLAMDAFAVAICKGLNMRKMNYKNALILALFFGGFQALMPAIGYLLGKQFEKYITSVDHWIAFILLSIIGIQMIAESFKKDDDKEEDADKLNLKEYFMLAIATSIDALAVGITFACIPVTIIDVCELLNTFIAVLIIGLCTFIISICGVKVGNVFGARYKNKAEFAGGVILILLGIKILLEYSGIKLF